MDKEFLHKVDVNLLKSETGLSMEEIAELVGISQSRNLYKWQQAKASGGSRPTYDAIALLMSRGATMKSLFGIDDSQIVKNNGDTKITREEIEDGVRKVLSEMMNAMNNKK